MDDNDDEEERRGKDSNFIRSNILILGFLAVGIVMVVIGLIQMMGARQAEIKFEEGSSIADSDTSTEIKVDVDGQVLKPGLYTLKSDARLADAISEAGGLTDEADRKAVNLAAKMTDGQKIYVPEVGEAVSVQNVAVGVVGNSSGGGGSGPVSINSASEAELDTLPGIGPVTAQKIIDLRPYGTIDDLLEKKAVGPATFEKIKDMVSL